LSEFYYLNYGAWEQEMPGILGGAKPGVPRSYRYMAEASRHFLDWQLKGLESGKHFFDQVPEEIAAYTLKKRFSVPPLPEQLEFMERESGFAAMLDTVKRYLQDDPGAYTFDEFFAQGQRLVQAGSFREALAWATVFRGSFPNSATVQTISGRSHLELGQKEQALTCYREALKLLPADPHLGEQQKEPLKAAIEQRIRQLTS
jgi:tetratricopeptide (TPR) repeat protein